MLQDDPALRVAAIGGGARAALLSAGVAPGRARSAARHHHSAVRAAGRHVGGCRALCRGHGVRRSRLHRRDHQSRRQRASQARRQRQRARNCITSRARAAIDEAEQRGRERLFAERSTVALSNTDHETIGGAERALHNALKRTYLGMLFRNNFVWSGIGLARCHPGDVAGICAAYADSYGSNVGGIIAGMLLPLLPIMIGVGIMRVAAQRGGRHASAALHHRRCCRCGSRSRSALRSCAYNIGAGPAILLALVPSMLAALASFGFSWLQSATREGRKIMDQIEGFRQYLNVAEEDRLEYLNPPKKTPELFEKFLPYAIALDVENSWAKTLHRRAGGGRRRRCGVVLVRRRPYEHQRHRHLRRSPGHELSQTISSAATPPGSSGGGGSGSAAAVRRAAARPVAAVAAAADRAGEAAFKRATNDGGIAPNPVGMTLSSCAATVTFTSSDPLAATRRCRSGPIWRGRRRSRR